MMGGAARAARARGLRATYRLQLTPQFGFADAAALIPYLRALGVSHLYLSPSLQARAGSTHGYDVVDPTRISVDRGGEAGLRALAERAHAAGMGIVLDVVPNHMAACDENRFWSDRALRERFFDIDPVSGRHRRFFDVDELAGVRVEDPEVFDATHRLVLELVAEGVVDGLRIDHPDGLADPTGYLQALRERGVGCVWVEKILATNERLPAQWPVSGTVGYEFLNEALGLFVDPAGEAALTGLWVHVSGDPRPFGAHAFEAKLEQALTTFAPELERLAHAERVPDAVAGPACLGLALASSPVYRTYEPPGAGEFITRFQQTTPAVVAKGIEDTAHYRYGRLLALNEVGGDPGRFGVAVEDFHAACAERAARHPLSLLATMTHDTKRSLDTRTRIAVLSQVPQRWLGFAQRWLALGDRHCTELDGRLAPDPPERYFILQTLVGVWPIEPERLDAYLEKALREAKRNTSWVAPERDYEQAVKRHARELSADGAFRAELEALLAELEPLTLRATLGQLALKLTCPGVPDIYQGDEHELLALVDPDNRRPVDFALRREHLARLPAGAGQGAGSASQPGIHSAAAPPLSLGDHKLWLTATLLGLREHRPEVFTGPYEPLPAGEAACVFMRGERELLVAVALPRAAADADPLVQGVPVGRWREVLSGVERPLDGELPLSALVDGRLGLGVYERL